MEGEVKSMQRVLMLVIALVMVSGCAATQTRLEPLSSTGYRLYEAASTRSSQLVAVINSRSQTTERHLPWGAPSPDGKHFYALASNTLQDIDPLSGAVLRTLQIPGNFQMPPATLGGVPGGLSQNGRYLVLQTTGNRTSSHMLLIDTSDLKVAKRIDLNGVFDFDAVDNNGQSVYVVEYPNAADSYYHVRVYEVPAGQLGAYTVADKGGPNEPMTGVRLSGVFSPDGQWLYSIYARDNKGAFVHALNLSAPFAFCLDLPGSGWTADPNAFQWSLALTPDGRHLYAANGAMGLVTQIDNLDGNNPSIVRTGKIASTGTTASAFVQDVAAKEMGPHGAVVSRDGGTLVTAGATGLLWIDTGTLRIRSHQLTAWTVWSLAGSPDGNRIYAVNDAGAIAELSMDGHVAATFDPAEGSPMGLLRVEAAS
jgi:DNA-binding beta-propeller fold protein YncE